MDIISVFFLFLVVAVVTVTVRALRIDDYHRLPNAPILRDRDELHWR